jgi:hypothetical protein
MANQDPVLTIPNPLTTAPVVPKGGVMTIPTPQPTSPLTPPKGGTMSIPTPQGTAPLTPPGGTMTIPTMQPTSPLVPPSPAGLQGYAGGGVVPQPNQAPPASFGAGNVVADYMNNLTESNSPYMQNARRRGLEMAGSRGMLNSSMAAGASQRAALESAMPMVNEMVGLQKSREGYASQDWLNNNQFNREFSAGLALMPIKSSFDMLNTLMSYGAENPSVYTPTVMSGLSNFFSQNMQDIMSNYFGGK